MVILDYKWTGNQRAQSNKIICRGQNIANSSKRRAIKLSATKKLRHTIPALNGFPEALYDHVIETSVIEAKQNMPIHAIEI